MTDRDKDDTPVTACKTVTHSKTEHTRHGVVRTEVTTPVKAQRGNKSKGGRK